MRSSQKYRMTSQRMIILEEVKNLHTHPTADQVYERVRKRLPRISMGTVYRNLDILSKTGLLKKIDPGHPQMRFDGNVLDHYHIVCMACGSIEDVPAAPPNPSLDNMVRAFTKMTSYRIFGHNVQLMGLCPGCMKEGRSSLEEKIKELSNEEVTHA